jgi:hypothetical protein
MRIPLLIALSLSISAHALPPVTQAQIDSLKLPFTLEQLTARLDEQFGQVDRPLLIGRTWETLSVYYSFKAARHELALLKIVEQNLRAIYALDRQRQEKAEVSDTEVLLRHNSLLSQQIAVHKKQKECRSQLLKIFQLCHVEIIYEHNEKSSIAQSHDRF